MKKTPSITVGFLPVKQQKADDHLIAISLDSSKNIAKPIFPSILHIDRYPPIPGFPRRARLGMDEFDRH